MSHQPSTINHSSHPPVFLLAGGNWRKSKAPDPLLQRWFSGFFRRPPTIAYVGAASGDDLDFFRRLSTLFRNAGAHQVWLAPTASPRADEAEARRVLNAANAVFVSGGDVEEGMRVLAGRELVPFLRHLHAVGKPFFGMSAGSIMLARSWVRWPDSQNDASAEMFDGLGIAPVFCDTHAEEEDWTELKALLRLSPDGSVGYGIPTSGAMAVYPDGSIRALGTPLHRFHNVKGRIEPLPDLRRESLYTPSIRHC